MADSNKNLVVAGISAASPFAQVLFSSSKGDFQIDRWKGVAVLANVVMQDAQWENEPSDALFNHPYIMMKGLVKSIRPLDGEELLDGVQRVEFPYGLGGIEEIIATKEATTDAAEGEEKVVETMLDLDENEFHYDETMVPEINFCYRFTFAELGLLGARGGFVEVPEIPEHVRLNEYVDMPINCDIVRIIDNKTKDTFWFVDVPSEEFRKQYGCEMETDSYQSGYQLVLEIPESPLMEQYADYLQIPGLQDTAEYKPDLSAEDGLEVEDFDLSNALFQDMPSTEVEPLVGHDLEDRQVGPMVTEQDVEAQAVQDAEFDLAESILDKADIAHEPEQRVELVDTTQSVEESVLDMDSADTGETPEKEFTPDEGAVNEAIETLTDDVSADEDQMLFGSEDEGVIDFGEDNKKRQNQAKQRQQARLEREQQEDILLARESVDDSIDFSEVEGMSDSEVEQLFG